MEEWFTLVREKTRLARFEKELLVRAEELELEARKVRLEEQLDSSLLLKGEDIYTCCVRYQTALSDSKFYADNNFYL